jgi:hypothetical protein
MAKYPELGIKYNASQPQLTLDQLAYKALTYEEVEIIPGASKGWYRTFKTKTLKFLVDVVLDVYMKYGREKVISLIMKTKLDKQTSHFILKIIEKFVLYFVDKNNYKQAKEETSDKVVASFSEFLDDKEKVNFAYTIANGTQEQVISEIQESIKNKANEIKDKWKITHVESTENSEQADINETIIPENILQQSPIQSEILNEQTPDTKTDIKEETNIGTWIAISISIATLIGVLIFVYHNRKKRRR